MWPFLIILLLSESIISCRQESLSTNRRVKKSGKKEVKDLDNIISHMTEKGEIKLRSIFDPHFGSYRSKITIPKNYDGLLYLSGLNITSLRDRFIKVRFNFGRSREPITLEGTIGQGEGMTPQTDTEFIILDLKDRPFENVRLLYNLFDYNNYWDTTTGTESKIPVDDPRDFHLYCRGLKLADDHTFNDINANGLCDATGEKCLYAYAKIKDKGLLDRSTMHSLIPKNIHINLNEAGIENDSVQDHLYRCLPDSLNVAQVNNLLNLQTPLSSLVYNTSIYKHIHEKSGNAILSSRSGITNYIQHTHYVYQGPFKAFSSASWEISDRAIFSPVSNTTSPLGIFQEHIGTTANPNLGYKSFLFPRATRLKLNAGIEHFASTAPFGPRTIISGGLASPGETDFMDGCNRRVQTYDSFFNEDISSCNVTATIEVLQEDRRGNEVVIGYYRDIKLQLIRSSLRNEQGQELLPSSFNKCSSSHACANDECCYNGACWSKKVVSKCLDENEDVGHGRTGEICQTDYECASLCCNQSTSRCAPHKKGENQLDVLCSKAPGQTCVGQEWCRVDYLPRCFKITTGTTPRGEQMCAKRCYSVPVFGTCINGICEAPSIMYENIDTSNCDDAIDPPTNIRSLQQLEEDEDAD